MEISWRPEAGDADLALADNLSGAEFTAIELLVRTAVRTERRAFERNACEQST
jgi:hypothetical protein